MAHAFLMGRKSTMLPCASITLRAAKKNVFFVSISITATPQG